MLIKFFKNGQGRGAGPVGYLIAREVAAYSDNRDLKRDAEGRVIMIAREPLPEVLRGNPAHTEALIDATPHQWSYRAGVLAFTREDNPSERQQGEAMDAFEALAFAGLEPNQRDILWVRHTHEGRVELHFTTPRMELTEGRSFNIAPPGFQKPYDALRDVLNHRYGWADPEAPERARDVVSVMERLQRGAAREAIHDWALDQVASGKIQDRSQLISALRTEGLEIPRTGKDYVTVFDPTSGQRLRLRGEIFHENWTRAATLERAAEQRANTARTPHASRLDRLGAETLCSRLRAFEQRRAEYNRSRYGRGRHHEPQGRERHVGGDTGGFEHRAPGDALQPVGGGPEPHLGDQHDYRHRLALEPVGRNQSQQERPDRRGADTLPVREPSNLADGSFEAPIENLSDRKPASRLPRDDRSAELIDGQSLGAALAPSSTKKEERHARALWPSITSEPAPDRARARVVELRRAVDESLRGLNGAVRSLGETLDRRDQQQAGRIGSLRELASRVSDFVDQRLRDLRSGFSRVRELAAGIVRERQGLG